jgi:hypothetical protein
VFLETVEEMVEGGEELGFIVSVKGPEHIFS